MAEELSTTEKDINMKDTGFTLHTLNMKGKSGV